MTSPPMTSLDLSGLSISSTSPTSSGQQRNDLLNNASYDPNGTMATAYYSTAPSSAPYAQQPYDTHQPAHFSNTIASMGSKARGGLPSVRIHRLAFTCNVLICIASIALARTVAKWNVRQSIVVASHRFQQSAPIFISRAVRKWRHHYPWWWPNA